MSLCPVCFTFFPDSSGGRHAVYCGNACKQKAKRMREKPLNADAFKKPRKARVKPLVTAEKHIGVSGTVHAFPLVAQQPVAPRIVSPVIRTVDELKAFFGAAL